MQTALILYQPALVICMSLTLRCPLSNSVKVTDFGVFVKLDDDLEGLIFSGEEGLNIPRSEEDCTTPDHKICTVYPKALAAVIRFADEISENRSRISLPLLETVPAENKIYWEYSNCVSASKADPIRERVIITLEIQSNKISQKFNCSEFCERTDNSGQMSLIEYIICRLEKTNNERIYCTTHLSRYVSIREIEVRFNIFKNHKRLSNYELTHVISKDSYPNIDLFNDFFEDYPQWMPENLEEAIPI